MANPPAMTARHPHVPNLIPFPAHRSGRTWTVAVDGSADFSSISDAVMAAADGDVISIAPGMYIESLLVNKAVHLVGPCDPRFVEEDLDSDEDGCAMIIGSGAETIRWSATGGSIRDLVITRADASPEMMLTSSLIRMKAGNLRVERSVLADGAHCAVSCRGGDIHLVRCHIRGVNVGACMLDTNVTMERTHVEGAEVLSLHVENGASAALKDNCFEGRTVLRGDIRLFQGNDIDTLFVHDALTTSGNRISSLVHVCDFRADAQLAIGV